MTIHEAQVDGRAVQYSVVRMLACQAPVLTGWVLMPHKEGPFFAVLCRECGFGVLGNTEEVAARDLLCTMNGYRHGHEVAWPSSARVQFDPQLIDHIYEAYDIGTWKA